MKRILWCIFTGIAVTLWVLSIIPWMLAERLSDA